MGIPKFLAEQLRQPSGVLGRWWVAGMLNRRNRRINERAIELLELRPADRVLDIGFGGGVGLGIAAPMLPDGKIEGADFSADMVGRARLRFGGLVASGHAEFRLGDIVALPYEGSEIFDKIYTVNTIYFWPLPSKNILEPLRLLKVGGRFVVAFHGKDDMRRLGLEQHGFTLFSPVDVEALFHEAGFGDVRIERIEGPRMPAYFAVGVKQAPQPSKPSRAKVIE